MTAPARAPIRLDEWRSQHRAGNPHKILKDAELEEFVNDALSSMSFDAIHRACVERFGAARAPSKSSIHRYWCEFFRPARPEQHRRKRSRKPRAPVVNLGGLDAKGKNQS